MYILETRVSKLINMSRCDLPHNYPQSPYVSMPSSD